MYKKALSTLAILVFVFIASLFVLDKVWPSASERMVRVSPVVYGHVNNIRMMPTHFYVNEDLNIQIVSDFANSRFLYNGLKQNGVAWTASDMPSLKRPHVLTYSPEAKKYFAVDTDNNQLISFSSFDKDIKNDIKRYSEVNGVPIGKRPHDIAYNTTDKNIYVVLSKGILRFTASPEGILESAFISKSDIVASIKINQPDLNFRVGYVRALTIVDGILYLSNSTHGNVIQITDFLKPETWTVKTNKKQPVKYAEKGSYEKDGLILNDIEFFNGYWYATNYYAGNVSSYLSDASVSKNKLIRWKTWEDFKNSRWEDLSHLVHPESITYNFTKSKDGLYVSMFHAGNDEGLGSGVYEISTGYF
jgi:hypothetical protein